MQVEQEISLVGCLSQHVRRTLNLPPQKLVHQKKEAVLRYSQNLQNWARASPYFRVHKTQSRLSLRSSDTSFSIHPSVSEDRSQGNFVFHFSLGWYSILDSPGHLHQRGLERNNLADRNRLAGTCTKVRSQPSPALIFRKLCCCIHYCHYQGLWSTCWGNYNQVSIRLWGTDSDGMLSYNWSIILSLIWDYESSSSARTSFNKQYPFLWRVKRTCNRLHFRHIHRFIGVRTATTTSHLSINTSRIFTTSKESCSPSTSSKGKQNSFN